MKTPSIILSITFLALPLFAHDPFSVPASPADAAAARADLLSAETQAQIQHTQTVLNSVEMQKIAQRTPAIKSMMARDLAALKDAAAATAADE